MAVRLKKMTLRGFKSIEDLSDFGLRPINLLIGANGAGKSNFISFFKLLSLMSNEPGGLQEHVAKLGGASAILHDGAVKTPQLGVELTFDTGRGEIEYGFMLAFVSGDELGFASEMYRDARDTGNGDVERSDWESLGEWHPESMLTEAADNGAMAAGLIQTLLRQCIVHQFSNTSSTARIRTKWTVGDGRRLKEDGANLAPFLYRLKENQPKYYRRIVETIRMSVRFFADFVLEPEYDSMILKWTERGGDHVFDASQASDGMLRFMALVALLSQPPEDLPQVMILDEPELGLHPFAINSIAGLLKSASEHSQIFLATQSTTLLENFEPEDIVVVNRAGRASTFERLNGEKLQDWLEEYTLGELWEKNVIGGRP